MALTAGCNTEPVAIPLVDRFSEATVENAVAAQDEPARIEWLFEGELEKLQALGYVI
jgi:hypothetical protein